MMSGYKNDVFTFRESSHFDAQQRTTLEVEWFASFIMAESLQFTLDRAGRYVFEAAHSELDCGRVRNHLHGPVIYDRECGAESLVPESDAFKRLL
jgi:hypothetical protein